MGSFMSRVSFASAKNGEKNTAIAWFFENHREKQGGHIHLLIRAKVDTTQLFRMWQMTTGGALSGEGCNYIRVLDYLPDYGASYYVAKYVVKDFADWDFSYVGKIAKQENNDLFRPVVKCGFEGWEPISSNFLSTQSRAKLEESTTMGYVLTPQENLLRLQTQSSKRRRRYPTKTTKISKKV
jgi:hypothetical protein